MKCIFCSSDFDTDRNSPEHVLLNSLGGRFTTQSVDCSNCNNTFGISIDDEMATSVQEIRCIGALRSGNNKLPPPIKNVLLKNGQKVDLLPGMIPINTEVTFKRKRLENGNLEVSFGAGSFEHLARLLPDFAKGSGLTLDQLISTIRNIDIQIQKQSISELIPFRFVFGGLHPTRSMAKSLVVLWCHHFGNNEFLSGSFSEIIDFIKDEKFAENNKNFAKLDSRSPTLKTELLQQKDFGDYFNLLHVSSDEFGNIFGVFRLYNVVNWIFNFKGKTKTINSNITLISNPIERAQWKIFKDNDIGLTPAWMNTPQYFLNEIEPNIGKFMSYLSKENEKINQEEMIVEAMRDYFPKEGETIEENHIGLISRDLAEEYIARTYCLDRTKIISGERVSEILSDLIQKNKK